MFEATQTTGRLQNTAAFCAMVAACASLPSSVIAHQKNRGATSSPGQASIISRGGRLYDSHWSVVRRQVPRGIHPLYPANAATPKTSSCRCVTCEGWDYAGINGDLKAQSTDGPFTSLSGLVNKDPGEIKKLLRRPSHIDVTAPLLGKEFQAIALFLSKGQHDMAALVQPNGSARGDPLGGKDIYESACQNCHGADGKAPIMGEPGDQSSLGWMARNRPAQTVHKIRTGVPNADMLSLRFLELERIRDLLSYLQRLDRK